MRKNMKQLMGWVSTVSLILLFLSCGKNKPLPTGYSNIFGDREGQVADTLIISDPESETFYSRLINTGLGGNLLIGNYQNYMFT